MLVTLRTVSACCVVILAGCRGALTPQCDPYWPDVPTTPLLESAASLRLEEIWRVAGSNEGQELAHPSSVSVSEAGRVAVVDYTLAEAIVVDSRGKWLGRWGRRGEGPGELTMPVAARWAHDTLKVFDIEQGKVASYVDGTAVGDQVRIAPEFIAPVVSSGEIRLVSVGAGNAVILMQPLRVETGVDSARVVVSRYNPSLPLTDTLIDHRVAMVSSNEYPSFVHPGAAQARLAVGGNGWTAMSAPDGSYRVLIRNAEGHAVRQLCRNADPAPLSSAEMGSGTPPRGLESAYAALAAAPSPDRLSAIGRMLIGPSGELWIDRNRAAPFTKEGMFGPSGSTLDVFDSAGDYLGTVTTPDGVSIQAVNSDMAIGLQFGEYDEPWLIGYRIVRG
jgi:hypothetical protein